MLSAVTSMACLSGGGKSVELLLISREIEGKGSSFRIMVGEDDRGGYPARSQAARLSCRIVATRNGPFLA